MKPLVLLLAGTVALAGFRWTAEGDSKSRPLGITPTPARLSQFGRNINTPPLTGQEASSEVLPGFLEPAPTGYQWTYRYDSDGSVIQKCLINDLEQKER